MEFVNKSKIEYSEKEAVLITIQYGGFDGSEFKTGVWKRHERLDMDRTQIALMKKLNTLANKVSLKMNEDGKPLRGKSRVYIIDDWKESQSKMESNRKGTPLSDEDNIMKDYIFSRLLIMHLQQADMNKTINRWAIEIGLENTKEIDANECVNVIDQLHENSDFNKISKYGIVQLFMNKLYERNTSVVSLAFKHLEREGKISLTESYFGRKKDKSVARISYKEYETFSEKREKALREVRSNMTYYNIAKHSTRKNMNQFEVIKQVESYLHDEVDIIDTFKTLNVRILDTKYNSKVSNKAEFLEAYYNKFFTLIENQQKSNEKTVQGRIYFTNKFYRLHMLTLIEALGLEETPRNGIRDEIRSFDSRLKELLEDLEELDRGKRETFGGFNEKSFPLTSLRE